ncbi:hypothetical protein HYC85_028173 [Camellia sinensis]|uniref:Uncharacterized protein n=1 Tax=Camellia sinensis TaxID=4442 RepID=A0A7J7FUJ4_CAMSI|nr:hypothetical protein HYC85_028173 [Camellia sinensis]
MVFHLKYQNFITVYHEKYPPRCVPHYYQARRTPLELHHTINKMNVSYPVGGLSENPSDGQVSFIGEERRQSTVERERVVPKMLPFNVCVLLL